VRARDEAEVWADGYGFMEFQRTGTGLVPYHHESRATNLPLPPAASATLADDKSAGDEDGFTLLA